ncbi:MAG: hypothetical protein Q8L45_01065 [Xanthomonadaceae bacterium]|nr:hypothetical protein [Xanthomonadaceae bacterium]MDZ4115478.1 hypothetical protein [Xanthomonadaceae bacterium]MDZ4378376.1 hypothetical protein [Xanthomonadaceae bacterium]
MTPTHSGTADAGQQCAADLVHGGKRFPVNGDAGKPHHLTDHPLPVFYRIMHRNISTTGTGTTMTRLRERVAG